MYDPRHDSIIVKGVNDEKDEDSEDTSDQEVMSLQKLSELRTMTSPLNSTPTVNVDKAKEAAVNVDNAKEAAVNVDNAKEAAVKVDQQKSDKSSHSSEVVKPMESKPEKGTEIGAQSKIPCAENEERKLGEKTK